MEFWWNNMLTLQKVLFIVACATTLIMVIQIILMLVGAGSNGFASNNPAIIPIYTNIRFILSSPVIFNHILIQIDIRISRVVMQ